MMPTRVPDAIFLIAAIALSTGATAQNAYRCGDRYSQLPCPGGVEVNVTDQRTAAQKEQADRTSIRNAQTADAMEKARLRREKIDLAANTPRAKPAAGTRASQAKKKKKKTPEFFTVQVLGQKKKAAAKKKAGNSKPISS